MSALLTLIDEDRVYLDAVVSLLIDKGLITDRELEDRLQQRYDRRVSSTESMLASMEPSDAAAITEMLGEHRGNATGRCRRASRP
jgi:hypothetical protein